MTALLLPADETKRRNLLSILSVCLLSLRRGVEGGEANMAPMWTSVGHAGTAVQL